MKVIVTGCSGFIGSHLIVSLLKNPLVKKVYGLDMIPFDMEVIKDEKYIDKFEFLRDNIITTTILKIIDVDYVFHLAGLGSVRNSVDNPISYINTNIIGTINLLEQIKNTNTVFIYASSSSVYGNIDKLPYREDIPLDSMLSPYAVSKLTMEKLAYTYEINHNVKTIGFRFFTVYGPRGRKDMFPHILLDSLINTKEITVYGNGNSYRDYTYVDDLVYGLTRVLYKDSKKLSPIYNLGSNVPIKLKQFISIAQDITGKRGVLKYEEERKSDVFATYADTTLARVELGYTVKFNIEEGMKRMYEYMISLKV